jgi:hypothetical protein
MTMNCLKFRRAVETDPGGSDELVRSHARECGACAAHAHRLSGFNRTLNAAMKTPVPEKLTERILLRHAFHSRSTRRFQWPALAAGLALLTSAAFAVMGYLHSESRLEHEVIALVDAADYALQARGPVAAHTLSTALKPVGLRLDGAIDNVSFAGRCLVRGNLSGHVVLRKQHSPITVFLMPEENLLRQTRFEGENWSGLLVPADHGAIAIVARRGQALDGVVQQVLDAIRWPA